MTIDGGEHTLRCHDEATLWREAGRGFGRLFRASAGFESWQTPSTALAVTGVQVPDLNCGVIDAGEAVGAAVTAMAGHLHSRRLPGLLLVTDAAGVDARAAAEAAGLTLAGRMPLMSMAAGIVAAQATTFTVRRVTDTADLSAANRIMAAAFNLPVEVLHEAFPPAMLAADEVCVDLVLEGEEPVGALQSTVAEGLAGIWSMATPPHHRRRGIARAGLSYALRGRFAEGCDTAFLIATDAGRPLYEAIGFRVAAWCDVWVSDPGSTSG